MLYGKVWTINTKVANDYWKAIQVDWGKTDAYLDDAPVRFFDDDGQIIVNLDWRWKDNLLPGCNYVVNGNVFILGKKGPPSGWPGWNRIIFDDVLWLN